jgi:hypothetical protein
MVIQQESYFGQLQHQTYLKITLHKKLMVNSFLRIFFQLSSPGKGKTND